MKDLYGSNAVNSFILVITMVILNGCATCSHSILCNIGISERMKMKLANESLVISQAKTIILNGEKLEQLNGRRVSAGAQQVTFNGQLDLKTTNSIENENQINTAACILILPLCVLNELVPGSNSSINHIDSDCFAKLEFTIEKSNEYIIKIENKIDSAPNLIVLEKDTEKTVAQVPMNCSPNQSLKHGTAQSAAP